jgi:hypothetical protein
MDSQMIFHITKFQKLEFALLAIEFLVHAVGVSVAFLNHDVLPHVDDYWFLSVFLNLHRIMAYGSRID